jgi:hypothetical protein
MPSGFYTPGTVRGVRFDDPVFGIQWPLAAAVVSEQDLNWPLVEQKEVVADIALREREASESSNPCWNGWAGATGSSIALQLATSIPGIRLMARWVPEPSRQHTGAV